MLSQIYPTYIYKNVINDIDEDIPAIFLVVAIEIFCSTIILITEISESLTLSSNFFVNN